ncbi:MAG: hypothetical protein DWC11_00825 [Candidatus Poseidoniales archaeon]|nr:MAG: hypothetical protein DWC11_00825 [Candidatus Poseidoniales archaeon]
MTDRRWLNVALACGLVALLLAGLGRMGYSTEGTFDDIPAPPSDDRIVFASDPLPEHPAPALFRVQTTVTWDRDDVWVAVVDQAEWERCQDAPASSFFGICTSNDLNAEVLGGPGTGEDGLVWNVTEGVHWAGYGSIGTPTGATLDLAWEADVQLAGAPTALLMLIGVGLIVYGRPRRAHSTPS